MPIAALRSLTVAALMSAAPSLVPAQAGAITISQGWFRTLPNSLPAAGFFTAKNSGTTTVAVTGASAPGCGQLMLHMTHNMNGMMHMMEVAKVDVPAGGSTAFATGGYHLMCMEPKLNPGAKVPVTLQFSDGSSVTAAFDVRAAGQ